MTDGPTIGSWDDDSSEVSGILDPMAALRALAFQLLVSVSKPEPFCLACFTNDAGVLANWLAAGQPFSRDDLTGGRCHD